MNKIDSFQNQITILMILYQEDHEMVSNCLKNIKNFKIIIIDNANNDILKKKITKEFKIYKYILNDKNIGFASAANQGINQCDTTHMLFLNADCLLTENNIYLLYEAKNKYQDCLIVAPTLYDENNNLTYNGGMLPESGHKSLPLNLDGDSCVETVITTAILFKISELKEIGSIDTNFFIYFVDDELCRRAKAHKKAIIQVFNSKAIHNHGDLKVNGKYNKIFIRNFHFTFDELYYYYKNNAHTKKLQTLKKKIYKYFIKTILNLFLFRFSKCVYYFSKILAYLKFVLKFVIFKK